MRQQGLFDHLAYKPTGSAGAVRTVVGSFFEEMTSHLFGVPVCKTDSRKWYCPDLIVEDHWLEVKGAGRGNETFVYKGRLAKDLKIVLSGRSLFYVIWHHGVNTRDPPTVRDLHTALYDNIQEVFIVPFSMIFTAAERLPVENINSKYGYGPTKSRTYGQGIRIGLDTFRPRRSDNGSGGKASRRSPDLGSEHFSPWDWEVDLQKDGHQRQRTIPLQVWTSEEPPHNLPKQDSLDLLQKIDPSRRLRYRSS